MSTSVIPPARLQTPPPNINVFGQDLPYFMPINVSLTANQTGVKNTIQVENDGEFEWRWIMSSSTGLFSLQFTNNYIKRPLMPTPINGENFAGTAQNPALLPVPYRLKRTSILEAIFNDRSGAPNTVQLVLGGYKKYSNTPSGVLMPSVLPYRKLISHVYTPNDSDLMQLQDKIPYWWPIFDATIGAQQAGRNKVTMPEGCYATHIVASSSQALGFILQIYDTERGLIFEDQPTVQNGSHCGTAQRAFWLKTVYRLPSDGQLQCRVINRAAAPNNVQVVICGVRD